MRRESEKQMSNLTTKYPTQESKYNNLKLSIQRIKNEHNIFKMLTEPGKWIINNAVTT